MRKGLHPGPGGIPVGNLSNWTLKIFFNLGGCGEILQCLRQRRWNGREALTWGGDKLSLRGLGVDWSCLLNWSLARDGGDDQSSLEPRLQHQPPGLQLRGDSSGISHFPLKNGLEGIGGKGRSQP